MDTIKDLYDLEHTLADGYLSGFTYPWEALKGIKELILTLGAGLGEDYCQVSEGVWVHKTARVAPTAIPVDLRVRLPLTQNSACQIPFRSFVSAIMYCISLFNCMCHTRCPCDTNVTRRVAGRVTHYYHTWLTLHKTKNRTVKGLHLLQCVIYGKI